MPIYLYEHTNGSNFTCKEEFEIEQRITEDALKTCRICGEPVKRLIAGKVAVSWKGGAPTPKTYL